jgi:hypothetical protein
MCQNYESRFIIALCATVVVETAVIIGLIRLFFKISPVRLSTHRCLFAGYFASFATLPYLWFVLPSFIRPYTILVTTGETGVYLLEALAYVYLLNLPFKKTFVLSTAANTASIIAGLFLLPPF